MCVCVCVCVSNVECEDMVLNTLLGPWCHA